MNRSSTQNRITYHQLPATKTTIIDDFFESIQYHKKMLTSGWIWPPTR